jgi:aminopeptidase N
MYAEALYLECTKDKAAGVEYLVGVRGMIRNDVPIIGTYGVNDVPRSQDRYPKGANMLMTMRAVVNDDPRWLAMLQGLNATFRHQTVTAQQVEDYMSTATGTDLQKIFQQYLETTMVPVLEYRLGDHTLSYRWTNVIPGFDMPVDVVLSAEGTTRLRPTTEWQTAATTLAAGAEVKVAPTFYVTTAAATANAP